MDGPQDVVVRVMTDDHAFRVVAAATTSATREIVAKQRVEGDAARALVGLSTGAVLLRETMAPNVRVQGLLRGAGGKGTLVGDSFPDGSVRGLAQLKGERSAFSLGPGSHMQMMRTLVSGALQQGIVDVGSAGGIGEALTGYFHESEQLVCLARVGSRWEGSELVAAGGFVVQLLPEAERPAHMIMTQRLEDFPPIDAFLEKDDFSADMLIREICHGMPFTELARDRVFFACRCDETVVLASLSTLGRADLEELIAGGEGLEIDCDYCGRSYLIAVERLRALLEQS
jgi:molecular chaperone Hsp33